MSIVLKFLSLLHGISGIEGMCYILGGALFLWIGFATVLVIFYRNFWLHKTWNRPFLALQPCNIGALQRQKCARRTSMPLAEPGRGEGGGHGPPDFSKFSFIILIKWEKRINFMEIKIPAPSRILRLENQTTSLGIYSKIKINEHHETKEEQCQ